MKQLLLICLLHFNLNYDYFLLLASCPSRQIENGFVYYEVEGQIYVSGSRSTWPVGTKAHYACDAGFSRFGKRSERCKQDGTWEESGPIKCQSNQFTLEFFLF